MAATITITVPPGSEVVLPDMETLNKTAGDTLSLKINNQTGSTITTQVVGSATKFVLGTVPASIANGVEADVPVEVVDSGAFGFASEEADSEVNIDAAPPIPSFFPVRHFPWRSINP